MMTLIFGETKRQIYVGTEKSQMTVTQEILEDGELVHTVQCTEPYHEGEEAEFTVKRFKGDLQKQINNWLKERELALANEERDAFMGLLKSELTL